MKSTRRLGTQLGGSSGAAAVEFALIVPLLLLLIFLLLDLGRLFYCQVSLNGAAREVARAAALRVASSTYPTIIANTAPSIGSATLGGFSMKATAVSWDYDYIPGTTTRSTACPSASATLDQTTYIVLTKTFHWMMPVGLLNVFAAGSATPGDSTITARAAMLCT